MANRSGKIGTQTESAVVRVVRMFWPQAERRRLRGAEDWGDITGTPGIIWEVKGGAAAKNASDGLIAEWWKETEQERQNADADVGVLVVQRKGVGAPNAARWWGIVPLSHLHSLLMGQPPQPYSSEFENSALVRLHLVHMISVLKAAGY
jgi:hypothetical protein